MFDDKKSFAFVFPGQGSQKIGMGAKLFKDHQIARQVFEEVDEALNMKLSKIIFEGPESNLTLTENTQPALMAVSVALVKVLEFESKKSFNELASIVCGHSLGEYSALCSIEAISLASTAKLLKLRGKSMQNAVNASKTGMVAIIGLDLNILDQILETTKRTGSICEIANDNCPGQIVLSGHKELLDETKKKCLLAGAKLAIDLKVSAPFHCTLMKPVCEIMDVALQKSNFNNFRSLFINNVTATFESDIQVIKKLLVEQVVKKVRWRETVHLIYKYGIKNIIEIGSGKVLSGLNKRMNLDINSFSIENLEDIDLFLKSMCK